jgi:hypothetical protein
MAAVRRLAKVAPAIPVDVIRHEPYPHLVRHNAVPRSLLNAARVEWPAATWPGWVAYADQYAIKRATRGRDGLPRACELLLDHMAAIDVAEITGEPSAFPDLTLYGAGLHEIPTDGHLALHLDARQHPVTGWSRVASAVVFVDDFSDTWGGELVLGDPSGDCRRITPTAGTLVVMGTAGDETWHAVGKVTGPLPRRTLAMFWWSTSRVESDRKRASFRET